MKKITLFVFLMIFSLGYSQSFPLDFESATTFVDFDGGVGSTIVNPYKTGINTSDNVGQIVKGPGAIWAGSKILIPSPISFSTKKFFTVKVLSPVAGRSLNLKFEGGAPFEKLSAPITQANVWEELTFDFTGISNNNSVWIVFMFDLGTQGDASANSTYLFDDVSQVASLSTASFETSKIRLYPNPAANYLTIEADREIQKISVYNILGQEVLTKNPKSISATLQTNSLQRGIYIAKTIIDGVESTSKFTKN